MNKEMAAQAASKDGFIAALGSAIDSIFEASSVKVAA